MINSIHISISGKLNQKNFSNSTKIVLLEKYFGLFFQKSLYEIGYNPEKGAQEIILRDKSHLLNHFTPKDFDYFKYYLERTLNFKKHTCLLITL